MYKAESCPHNQKCMLLKKDFNNNCEICQMCQKGMPDEYAVHVKHHDGISEVHRLTELPSLSLNSNIDHVTIYCLSRQIYYSKEVITFQPSTASEKNALYAQVSKWT